jgi:hypothetical protein
MPPITVVARASSRQIVRLQAAYYGIAQDVSVETFLLPDDRTDMPGGKDA